MDTIMRYPIKQLVTRPNLKCVRESDLLTQAILLMDQLDVGALPVINHSGSFVGVLSKTDIASERLLKMLKKLPMEEVLVGHVMNHNTPVTVKDTETVASIVALMHNKHIHRVFVMNENSQVYSVISTTDMIKVLFIENMAAYQNATDEVHRQFFHSVRDSHERFMKDFGWNSKI